MASLLHTPLTVLDNSQMSLQDYTLFDPCKIIWYKATFDSIFLLKNENFKCHPKQGPDDLVTFPALDATVEFIKLLCLSFMIEK